MFTYAFLRYRLKKTWPSRTRFKFGTCFKQGIVATHAAENSVSLFILMRTAKCPLGTMLSRHLILLRSETGFPFRIGFFYFCHSNLPCAVGVVLMSIPACAGAGENNNGLLPELSGHTAESHRLPCFDCQYIRNAAILRNSGVSNKSPKERQPRVPYREPARHGQKHLPGRGNAPDF